MAGAGEDWCLVLPVKRLEVAKSRLGTSYGELRPELALAFALDTAAAALAASRVRGVVAVTDDARAASQLRELGATVVADEPDAGLNPALRHGLRAATALHPGCGTGALSSDLPALRPAELDLALRRAAGHLSAFVRDHAGRGTTLVLAAPGAALLPEFGTDSARRHLDAGHHEVEAHDLRTLRLDVDTPADLDVAVALGVGPRTAAVLG